MPDARLRVRGAGAVREATFGAVCEPLVVDAGEVVHVEVVGAEPDSVVSLELGRDVVSLRTDSRGGARWADRDLLSALAGRLAVRACGLSVPLEVRPNKLTEAALLAMLDDLEATASGLSAELGGQATGAVPRAASHADAVLAELEAAAGVVGEASAWIRRKPLHRTVERVRPVPAPSPRLSARDARWLARSPAALRMAVPGRALAVKRDRVRDLDLPENRGVVGLLSHLQGLVEQLEQNIAAERSRIHVGRAERERFRTRRGNLYAERDVPRLRALVSRSERVAALRSDLDRARIRCGLPASLPAAPMLPRSAAVEGHPGYWNLRRLWERLHGVGHVEPRLAFAPLDDIDTLYEVWSVLQVVAALAEIAGTTSEEVLELGTQGWFVELPRRVAVAQIGDAQISVLYEPAIGRDGDGQLARVTGRAPLRPDVCLLVRRPGARARAHIFDAKHRLDRSQPREVPLSAVHEVWTKYGEAFGYRGDGAPAVDSVWVLYPGETSEPFTISPHMLEAEWPAQRLRVGAVPLLPRRRGALSRILRLLLR